MMRRISLLLPISIAVGIEVYILSSLRFVFEPFEITGIIYWLFQILGYGSIIYAIASSTRKKSEGLKSRLSNAVSGLAISFVLSKVLLFLLLILGDFSRGLYHVWNLIVDQIRATGNLSIDYPERSSIIIIGFLLLSFIFFILLVYGVLFGKYRYQVRNVVIESAAVPDNFNGYKIVQISDIHSGSFDNKEKVKKGVDIINEQVADLLVFTGDLVNNIATEIEPFIEVFGSIKSKDGKFSVLGNHDYGSYVRWPSEQDQENNLRNLIVNQERMGFEMMMNRNQRIERNGEYVNLIGVENWGKPPFPQYGDLEKATQGIASDEFNILLSHDPSHWDQQVKFNEKDINLTLSGHTHGMQLGIEFLGIKWSPVKYRYRKWAGLYTENDRHLYVNRGFGVLGWSGRLGIWPEITVIELRSTK